MEIKSDCRVKVKKVCPLIGGSVPEPRCATSGSAGLDLPACISNPVTLAPGEIVGIPTGIAIELPSELLVALVFPRSGLAAKHGVTLANAVGVIDADYRGEIVCPLINLGKEPFTVKTGDRIAQLLVVSLVKPALEWVEELSPSGRGAGGFGSTGI
ncbi:dUTP diphosphatase [Desulforudis sp. 1088]|uniref:dUTP diphosphatase n=1 Tax=unclassified Candidatus Desulforudis TaxID=2635950 RepID=UPI0034782520